MKDQLSLFVYGSLKPGECNDHVISQFLLSAEEAHTHGALRLRPDDYPALYLEGYESLGTADYWADLKLETACECSSGEKVPGQLLTLREGARLLARLDEFEGFFPGRTSEYLRVALSVATAEGLKPCWTYIGVGTPPHEWRPLASWPPPGLVREPEPYEHGL